MTDKNQQMIWAYLRLNPDTHRADLRQKFVVEEKRMDDSAFDTALKHLSDKGYVVSRNNFLRLRHQHPPREFGNVELERKEIRIKVPKHRVYKSKVVFIKRQHIEGLKCRKCGHFIERAWSLRSLRKCPKCGLTVYRGKPVLVKSVKVVEKLTKHGRELRKLAFASAWRIKKPTLSDLGYANPEVVAKGESKKEVEEQLASLREIGDDRGFVVQEIYDPKMRQTYWALIHDPSMPKVILPSKLSGRRDRRHIPMSVYTGSELARDVARKAWETRRKMGWKVPKSVIQKRLRKLRGKRVLVGFFRDKDKKTRPITKPVSEVLRKKIVSKPKKAKPVKPKKLERVKQPKLKTGLRLVYKPKPQELMFAPINAKRKIRGTKRLKSR